MCIEHSAMADNDYYTADNQLSRCCKLHADWSVRNVTEYDSLLMITRSFCGHAIREIGALVRLNIHVTVHRFANWEMSTFQIMTDVTASLTTMFDIAGEFSLFSYIQLKSEIFTYFHIFRDPDVVRELSLLRGNFVIVPADKASNNYTRDITPASCQRNLDLTHSLGNLHTISWVFLHQKCWTTTNRSSLHLE